MTPPLHFKWYEKFLERTIEKRNLVIILSVILMGATALAYSQTRK